MGGRQLGEVVLLKGRQLGEERIGGKGVKRGRMCPRFRSGLGEPNEIDEIGVEIGVGPSQLVEIV